MIRLNLVWATLAAAVMWTTGCGYIGDPLPPALNIPRPVKDLKVVQRGDKLVATFTIPPATTEDLPVKVGEVEMRIGPITPGEPFDISRWAAGATGIVLEVEEPGPVTRTTASTPFTGKEVTMAVRVAHRRGRTSEWSNLVSLTVTPPPPTPVNLVTRDAGRGVEVTWKAPVTEQTSFRILRQGETDKEPAPLGESKQARYLDETIEYGKPYRYQVQTTLKAGNSVSESELSEISKPFSPRDISPPAAPVGLTLVAGISTIELSWERNVEPDLSFYRVYRLEENGSRKLVGDNIATPVYSDRQVESGKRYRYVLTAVDRAGNESPASAPAELTAP